MESLGRNGGASEPRALLLARPRTRTALFKAQPPSPERSPVSLPNENVALKRQKLTKIPEWNKD